MGKTLLAFQHALNPLHIYCRLLDRGMGRGLSETICKMYEALLFSWLNWILKSCMYFADVTIVMTESGEEPKRR